MIIPIGHDQTIRGYPWVTISIISICTIVQVYASTMAPTPRDISRLSDAYDQATPADAPAIEHQLVAALDKIPIARWGYQTGSGATPKLLLSAFVHDGWLHLIGNMLFLFLAGSALEDRWGRIRFLVFYLVAAAAATLCFNALYSGPATILVGASGAISGLMGGFLIYFSRAQITFWYFLFLRAGTFQLAAYFALPLWLADQMLWASLGAGSGPGVSGTAYSAHIGGFAFGIVAALVGSMIGRTSGEDAVTEPTSSVVPKARVVAINARAEPARRPPTLPNVPRVRTVTPEPSSPTSPEDGPSILK